MVVQGDKRMARTTKQTETPAAPGFAIRGLDFAAHINQPDSRRKALQALRNSTGLLPAHVLTVAL